MPERLVLERMRGAATPPARKAYFGPEKGWLETPVVARADLATSRLGPCIVEEYDTTCLVPPGATASLDGRGNIIVELG
jgi:N-methylhydantoinase A